MKIEYLNLPFDVEKLLIDAQQIALKPYAFHPAPEVADRLSQLRAALDIMSRSVA